MSGFIKTYTNSNYGLIIVHKEEELYPYFNDVEKAIVLASNAKKIMDYTRAEVETSVCDSILIGLSVLGHKKAMQDDNDILFNASDVTSFLFNFCKTMTMEDFSLAMYMGTHGEFTREGEITFISATNICNWVRTYRSNLKTEALKKQKEHENKLRSNETIPISVAQAYINMVIVSMNAFTEYKEKRGYNDFGNIVYDFLDSEYLIPFNNEQKKEMLELAKLNIIKQNNTLLATSISDKNDRRKQIKSIQDYTKEGKYMAVNEAKKISLIKYFEILVHENKELKEQIKTVSQLKKMKISDEEIIKTTRGFTKGLLNKRETNGMCYIVCWPLQSFLSVIGLDTKLIEGEIDINDGTDLSNHFWLKLSDDRILDPTANQFKTPDGNEMPKIYLGEKPKWYKEIIK